MNISTQLNDFQTLFLPHLEAFFDNQRQKIASLWPLAQDMFEKLAEFTLRNGKRTRPALLYYSYQFLSHQDPLPLIPLCIACELMQSFLLIHDDIMDHADLRRGGKTIHLQFQSEHDHYYGQSMAILIGNLAGYLGLQTISDCSINIEAKNYLMNLYSQIGIDAGYGQALDISFDDLANLTETHIYTIYRYKTSRYTTEFPLIAAAILSNLTPEQITKIKTLAVDLGILFQIKDDVMGLFGDEKMMGKPLDAIYNKKTLLIGKAFELGNETQKQTLTAIFNDKNESPDKTKLAKKIIFETGALTYAENCIEQRMSSSKEIIDSLPLAISGKNFLLTLVDYYAQRCH